MQIIQAADAKTFEFGFYLWREHPTNTWQFARIIEEGWLELFTEDVAGGSDHFTPFGELFGPVQPNQLAIVLAKANEFAESVTPARIPNPKSQLLADAVVGGAGLGIPPNAVTPDGMATVLLYVPIDHVLGKTVMDIQADLGLPWYAEGGKPVWFDELGISE